MCAYISDQFLTVRMCSIYTSFSDFNVYHIVLQICLQIVLRLNCLSIKSYVIPCLEKVTIEDIGGYHKRENCKCEMGMRGKLN